MRLAASKVHFIGIGGIGMCGLAELLHNMGAKVTGSDMSENAQTQRLKNMGVVVHKGHKPEHLESPDVVVYSSAVKPDNVEFQKARREKIPLIARAEALAEIMRLKRGIAVGGTHGKTTTTSLAASIFIEAQTDPTIVVGGRLDKIKSTAQLGRGDWLIAEADESDGSFSRLSPEMVIVTNIDDDHMDHYHSFENLQRAFYDFASRIPFYGSAVVCGDDPEVRELFASFPKKLIFYGFDSSNDYVLDGRNGSYEIHHQGRVLGKLNVPIPGRHNASNALAATIVGLEAGIPFDVAARAVAAFNGVDRRFQHKGLVGGVDVYDDYGHHPTEVRAVLSAFREKFPDRRLVVLFQPHRYSRTESCWSEFLTCFESADHLLLLDIYAAGEAPLPGIDARRLVAELDHGGARYVGSKEAASELLPALLKAGDVFVTLGAGDVWKVGENLLSR